MRHTQKRITEPRAKKKIKIGQTDYWRNSIANGWTLERKQRQAELIKTWNPWEQPIGPRTKEGKAIASQNETLIIQIVKVTHRSTHPAKLTADQTVMD